MRLKKRKWDESEDDPAAGLLNLFDVWIAFAAALLLAVVSYDVLAKAAAGPSARVRNEGTPEMEIILEEGKAIARYRPTLETRSGDGERLGTAYRLKTGEVIYVPERKAR